MRILIRLLTCQRTSRQRLHEQPAVLHRGAQEALAVLRPAQVKVAVVLPGHPEPTVQLQCVAGHPDKGLGAMRPCYRRRLCQFGALFTPACGAQCAAGGGEGSLDEGGHVDTAMLECLKRPDRPAELEPGPQMFERAREYLLARSYLLGGQGDGDPQRDPGEPGSVSRGP